MKNVILNPVLIRSYSNANLSIKKKIAITIKGISIGCGIGVDVKLLRDYDIDVIGIEPSNSKPIESMKKYIKTDSSSLLVDNYNTVFLLEVLEHLKEPNKMLDDIIKSYSNVLI